MADTENADNLVFGLGNPMRRCPVTGRPFEVGSGALPEEQQTANFIRERDRQRHAASET